MSRKKVRKETVKRKTNIYDPMGVYGRGLTENQRLGMTRQMKIENIRNPEKSITREELEEYRKTLEFYGMYKRIPTGSNGSVTIHWSFGNNATFSKFNILNYLINQLQIQPIFFVCNSFVITRMHDSPWDADLFYEIIVGRSHLHVNASPSQLSLSIGNMGVTIPSYFINGTEMNYFQLYYDDDLSDMFIEQETHDLTIDPSTDVDFYSLQDDGSPIPYLTYPDDGIPELQVRVGFNSEKSFLYGVDFNVFVIY